MAAPQSHRIALRLAFVVGLLQGLAQISGLAFGYYAPLACLSVMSGTYGNTLELGRQRVIGTVIGGVILFFAFKGFVGIPLALALPLALLLARLVAGAFGLTVGYTVCCFVVAIGWLKHENVYDSWISLRIFWTSLGVIVSLLALRLIWPSRARMEQRLGLLKLLVDLASTLEAHIQREQQILLCDEEQTHSTLVRHDRKELQERLDGHRQTLLQLRSSRPAAMRELGARAADHPVARMWVLLDGAAFTLILAMAELSRLPAIPMGLSALQAAAEERRQRAEAIVARLRLWESSLGRSMVLPPAPADTWRLPGLSAHHRQSLEQAFQTLTDQEQTGLASRLFQIDRIDQMLREVEVSWGQIIQPRQAPVIAPIGGPDR